MDLLKKKSRLHHIEIMHQPYFQDLLKGQLKIELYYKELFNLREIYSVLANTIEKKVSEDVKILISDYNFKVVALKNDINFLKNKFQVKSNIVFKSSEDICEKIKSSNELEILGMIYVFEGSSLGSDILSDRLKKIFNLNDLGIEFLANHNYNLKIKWTEFSSEMNKRILLEEEQVIIINSALNIFKLLNKLYREICEE